MSTATNYPCDGCGVATLRPLLRWCPDCYATRRSDPPAWSACNRCGGLNGRHAITCSPHQGPFFKTESLGDAPVSAIYPRNDYDD